MGVGNRTRGNVDPGVEYDDTRGCRASGIKLRPHRSPFYCVATAGLAPALTNVRGNFVFLLLTFARTSSAVCFVFFSFDTV